MYGSILKIIQCLLDTAASELEKHDLVASLIPQTELAMRGSNGIGKGALRGRRGGEKSV